jgi:hypothetical protein
MYPGTVNFNFTLLAKVCNSFTHRLKKTAPELKAKDAKLLLTVLTEMSLAEINFETTAGSYTDCHLVGS